MQSFEIIGGKKLKGEITPQGAKNEALQIISAVLLTDQVVRISNIPDIVDVNKLIDLLQDMGVKVVKESKDTYTFQADQIDQEYFKGEVFKQKGSPSTKVAANLMGNAVSRTNMGTPGFAKGTATFKPSAVCVSTMM